ncbi:hypothetical protein [Hwanghaeella sp.]|uniref:hypothetical protein n=1 Tax=Hwanghaeella sp. TaxID=2605943 RepID=UPI003CCBBF8B
MVNRVGQTAAQANAAIAIREAMIFAATHNVSPRDEIVRKMQARAWDLAVEGSPVGFHLLGWVMLRWPTGPADRFVGASHILAASMLGVPLGQPETNYFEAARTEYGAGWVDAVEAAANKAVKAMKASDFLPEDFDKSLALDNRRGPN